MKDSNAEFQRLQKLYLLKVRQLGRALTGSNRYRCQVLEAEAEAICDELKELCPSK
ncbi:hypothetical protein [Alkalimarinus coralli]|uniref:hypothetical protein n=1 Tax=Alkalimarinus coralli TaxID=2935863 RepID=UPI00202AFB13|nr:hypothetical protein [Alkalimarinus coralli]